jgi:hypothetical protein
MKTKSKAEKIKDSENYILFLEKRLASENYKKAVSKEEYQKTKDKLAKERLILKLMK